jgi:hypothetical protein
LRTGAGSHASGKGLRESLDRGSPTDSATRLQPRTTAVERMHGNRREGSAKDIAGRRTNWEWRKRRSRSRRTPATQPFRGRRRTGQHTKPRLEDEVVIGIRCIDAAYCCNWRPGLRLLLPCL